MKTSHLEDLFTYEGLGVKPVDFDNYWDEELNKVENHPLNYTVEPVMIDSNIASCYRLTFESLDGAKISCQLLKPKNRTEKKPGMLFFHGYHTNSGDFSDKIGWAAEGYVVLAMDCRGQGGLSESKEESIKGSALKGFIIRGLEDGRDQLYYRKLFLDTVIAARVLMSFKDVNEEDIAVQGASQGGALALICASLEPRIKKVFSTHPFLCDYRKTFEMDIQNSAYEELYYWFRFRDPLHEREDDFFNTLEYIDVQHFVPRIKAKVILAVGLADVVCFPITQFAAYNKLTCPKKLFILPEYGHEYYPRLSDNIRGFFINDRWENINQH